MDEKSHGRIEKTTRLWVSIRKHPVVVFLLGVLLLILIASRTLGDAQGVAALLVAVMDVVKSGPAAWAAALLLLLGAAYVFQDLWRPLFAGRKVRRCCAELERLASADDVQDIDLAILAGKIAIQSRRDGVFAKHPSIEHSIDNAIEGRISVLKAAGDAIWPMGDPVYQAFFVCVLAIEGITGNKRRSTELRPMVLEGSAIIVGYVRDAHGIQEPHPAALESGHGQSPDHQVDRLRALKLEGETLLNTWESGHAAGPAQWRKEWAEWHSRVVDALKHPRWTNAHIAFSSIPQPPDDPNWELDGPETLDARRREAMLLAQVAYISRLLVP